MDGKKTLVKFTTQFPICECFCQVHKNNKTHFDEFITISFRLIFRITTFILPHYSIEASHIMRIFFSTLLIFLKNSITCEYSF